MQVRREWSVARQHVQSLRATDPRGAERLNKDITAVSLDVCKVSTCNAGLDEF